MKIFNKSCLWVVEVLSYCSYFSFFLKRWRNGISNEKFYTDVWNFARFFYSPNLASNSGILLNKYLYVLFVCLFWIGILSVLVFYECCFLYQWVLWNSGGNSYCIGFLSLNSFYFAAFIFQSKTLKEVVLFCFLKYCTDIRSENFSSIASYFFWVPNFSECINNFHRFLPLHSPG